MLKLLGLCIFLISAGCATSSPPYNALDFSSVAKIDVHVHINSADTSLIDQARADRFRLLTLNVDSEDFPPLKQQQAIASTDAHQYPGIVAFAASFSMEKWDDSLWQVNVLSELDLAFAEGAVAVKVWKNVGMSFRDRSGKLVMIDDPKFDAIFDHVRAREKVLIGHEGEPHNCWLPIEQMSVRNDRIYFGEHPEYHMYLHPELPSYEEQMAARDRMLDKNPRLRFVGAHMASLEWSIERLANFLDRYPNAVVDLAARMGQVQDQSKHNREAVRAFFIKYQDRVLYGTDITQNPDVTTMAMRKEAHTRWWSDWLYLGTAQVQSVAELDGPVRGLALPRNVIDKIYHLNAERWFGKGWQPAVR